MLGAWAGSASVVSSAADALASASAVSAPPRPRAPSGPSIATVWVAIRPYAVVGVACAVLDDRAARLPDLIVDESADSLVRIPAA